MLYLLVINRSRQAGPLAQHKCSEDEYAGTPSSTVVEGIYARCWPHSQNDPLRGEATRRRLRADGQVIRAKPCIPRLTKY